MRISSINQATTSRPLSQRAFTLVEMLTVMAIIALLSLSVPALQSALTSGTFNSNTSQMNDLLKGAYSAALARNTYVWVGLTQLSNNGGVGMSFIYSQSGSATDINAQATLYKPVILKNLSLTNIPANVMTNRITAGSIAQVFSSSNTLNVSGTTDRVTFSTTIEGTSQTLMTNDAQSTSAIIEITPTGQVSIASKKYAWVEIGLKPTNGNSREMAALQMNAFTGRVVQYLP